MLDMYVSNVLSLKRFHGAETGNTHECLLKLSIGRVRSMVAKRKEGDAGYMAGITTATADFALVGHRSAADQRDDRE